MGEDGKTEKPTPKRIKDARKDGNFPRTPDAAIWLSMGAGAAMLPYTVSRLSETFIQLLANLNRIEGQPTTEMALQVLGQVPMAVVMAVAPFSAVTALAAVAGMAAQGVYPSSKAMKPNFKRMAPLPGVKRMFGPKALWEALKSLLKVIVIALSCWVIAKDLIPELLGPGLMQTMNVVERARSGALMLMWTAIAAGIALAFADYAYQRHTVMKKLKMAPKEVKDEHKQSEGDPQIKSAIRSKQMAMSRSRMLSAVVDADVVLVNPTHLAIALKYEPMKGAPRVVAMGSGNLAQKIRERAREHRVPVVEDKPLARLVYRVCDLGDEIPAELYEAVARILAFVMAAGRPASTAGARRNVNAGALPELPSKPQMRARRARETREARAASR